MRVAVLFFRSILVAGAIGVSMTASAQTPPSNPAEIYPELRPRALLIEIIKALDTSIADPRSMTDVILCPPTKIRYERRGERRPRSWYVAFSMNSRSSEGGYTGRTMYGAAFRVGKPTRIHLVQMESEEGFNGLINDAIRKQMKDCPAVSNDQLAELIGTTDRPTVDISR